MRIGKLRRTMVRAALAVPLVVAINATASAQVDHHQQAPQTVEYVITELGSLGGTNSAGISINNRSLVAGTSNLPGDEFVRATVWRRGTPTSLGTLGGPNSAVLWPNKNDRGIVVGVAETADDDLLDEQWSCSVFFPSGPTGHVCRGFVWERGQMRELPTHGGTHGFAAGVNNRGQVVGWAETPDPDPSCRARDQVLGFLGAIWDTRHGDRIHELPPLPDDSASSGTAINDLGQVVGISGDCDQAVGRFTARRPVLWENGQPIDLGTLGGEAWNTAMAINNKGVVVGFGNASVADGETLNERPFRWTEDTGIQDLGTLPGDPRGQALGLNEDGQVVGMSRGNPEFTFTAVMWQGDDIVDLNSLAPDYDGHLWFANDINDAGVITGAAISAATGETVAFVAEPQSRHR